MIEKTKKSDILIPEARTIIKLTFGNASIRLNLASAVKGYHAIIILLEKIHQKKVDVLKTLGQGLFVYLPKLLGMHLSHISVLLAS